MTICIASICDSSKKVIVASDRMITTGDLTVAFEHDVPKITQLSGNCLVLTAGPALVHTDLFRNVKSTIHAGAVPPISVILDKIKAEYLRIRLREIEERYFNVRGFDISWFNENQRMLSPDTVLRLDRVLEAYDRFDLHILIAGVDAAGAHVYYVYPPSSSDCFEALGYCSIGTGERHADSTFISYRYAPSFSLYKALYITYEAKKRAEIAVGVGEHTDMAIIDNVGITYITKETLEKLEDIYKKRTEIIELKNEDISMIKESLSDKVVKNEEKNAV